MRALVRVSLPRRPSPCLGMPVTLSTYFLLRIMNEQTWKRECVRCKFCSVVFTCFSLPLPHTQHSPYSPSAKKKAALTTPTSQPAARTEATSDLFSPSSLPAPKTQQQQQQQQQQRQLDDSWNIERKPEAPKSNRKKGEDNELVLASSSKKPATPTSTSSRPSSSPGKTTAEAASAIIAAAAASPSTKLPDGVLLARVSTRSIFVRG